MPKIIGDTLATHRQTIRQRLFDALSELLSTIPFDAITMSQIAQRAKVGRTAVYNHFPDKEVLLLAYMREVTEEFTAMLKRALATEENPIEQLRIYLRAYLEISAKYHITSGVSLHRQVSPEISPHLADHASIVGRVLLDILAKAMNTGAIPPQNPHLLVSLIHSAMSGRRLPSDMHAREEILSTVEVFILRAIGAPPSLIEDSAFAQRQDQSSAQLSTVSNPEHVQPLLAGGEIDAAAAYMRCPVHA